MADITELAQSLKAAANKAGSDDWQAKKISGDFYVIRKGSYSSRCGYTTYQPIAEIDHKPTRDYVAIASPANILALVEALEKAQRYTEELREWNAGLAQESCERQQRLAELAAENVILKENRNNLAEFIHEELDADYPLNMNQETNATDRIVAGIKADGVEEFAESQKEYVRQHRNEMDQVLRAAYAGSAVDAERFAKQLREGADK